MKKRVPEFSTLRYALTMVVLLLIATVAFAQTETATLSGTVMDRTGAVIPDSQIRVTHSDTNATISTVTNGSGVYVIPALKPGRYRMTVMKQGFKQVTVTDLILNVQATVSRNFTLDIGATSESVTVTAETVPVNTSAAVATVVDRKFVANLPLNGRSFQSLLLITPGVVGVPGRDGDFSVNGQRSNANYFTVDGVSANIAVSTDSGSASTLAGTQPGFTALAGTNNLVSVDALEEFKIQTSTYSAEYGRQPGGQVQMVTRSGQNAFHGTGFEYWRNDALDARNWFDGYNHRPRSPLRQNQFGGTFSGPVLLPKLYDGHNRTFFFFSYEGQRLRLPESPEIEVPSTRLRAEANPAVAKILNSFPLPTGPEKTGLLYWWMPEDPVLNPMVPLGVAPYNAAYSVPSTMDSVSVRIDHTVNSKLNLFGRYSETPSDTTSRSWAVNVKRALSMRTVTLGANLMISPQLTNELRFNYSRNKGSATQSMDAVDGAVPISVSDLVSGYNGTGKVSGHAYFNLGTQGMFVDLGDILDSHQRQYNLVDNVSWSKGRHQFKFGVDYRRLAPIYGPVEYDQHLQFYDENDIKDGNISVFWINASQGARPIYNNFSTFVQDTWRVTPRLTLDLGLRWELNPAPHDANGKKPTMLQGVENIATATVAPAGAPFYKTFHTAFAPRVGLSYQLHSAAGRETVLRGGFGVFYDLGNGQAGVGFDGLPFRANSGYIRGAKFPMDPQYAVPPAFSANPTPDDNLFALNPDLELPYTLQWNAALEQSLGRKQVLTLSYVASAARRLLVTHELNSPPNVYSDARPNPNFGYILYTTNGPTSDYQSLQAQYQYRLSHGLQATANYTWAHAIDEVSSELEVGTYERASANFDVRHNFSSALSYDIPKLNVTGLNLLFRNWSMDSILFVQTGTPIDVTYSIFATPGGRVVNVRPNVVPGVPFWVKDSTVPGGQRINPAAFTEPPMTEYSPYPWYPSYTVQVPAAQGNLGRNAVRNPLMYQWNMSVRRQFNITERFNLQVRADAFNVLNHPLFNGGYRTSYFPGDTTFGIAANTMNDTSGGGARTLYQLGGPRSMQLSLKLTF